MTARSGATTLGSLFFFAALSSTSCAVGTRIGLFGRGNVLFMAAVPAGGSFLLTASSSKNPPHLPQGTTKETTALHRLSNTTTASDGPLSCSPARVIPTSSCFDSFGGSCILSIVGLSFLRFAERGCVDSWKDTPPFQLAIHNYWASLGICENILSVFDRQDVRGLCETVGKGIKDFILHSRRAVSE
ncbi:MAG: hypothetical protein BMS9Abin37_2214 [Acidobacteriota bacterium]|nr:MAG: hypothetical protein BMS9Abin37_2214 [Acidobacteriota bacterium]